MTIPRACRDQRRAAIAAPVTRASELGRTSELSGLLACKSPHRRKRRTLCFKVKEVIGVSLCMEQMSAAERRVGRERADEEIRCQVRGKFGSDADEDTDDTLPDTRWVKLSELTDNIREADLKALDEFTRGLNKAIKDARRRLRQ